MRKEVLTVISLAAVLAVSSVMASGCSSKRKDTGELDAEARASAQLDEDRLAGRASLEQFEARGTVAAGGPFRDVFFGFDAADLDSGGREAVRYNAGWLSDHPETRVEIEGHCDERGTAEYNLALGARRAKSVRDGLIAEGIRADRLSTVSYGEELPVCKESTESCWTRNRRAHLVDLTR